MERNITDKLSRSFSNIDLSNINYEFWFQKMSHLVMTKVPKHYYSNTDCNYRIFIV